MKIKMEKKDIIYILLIIILIILSIPFWFLGLSYEFAKNSFLAGREAWDNFWNSI